MPTRGAKRRAANRKVVEPRQPKPAPVAVAEAPKPAETLAAPEPFYFIKYVQPLERRSHAQSGGGISQHFKFTAMHYAEYEVTGQRDSFHAMRAEGLAVIRKAIVTHPYFDVSREVYFVGPERDMDAKFLAVERWIALGMPTRGACFFEEAFLRGTTKRLPFNFHHDTVGWWDIRANLLWALDEKTAKQLRFGLNSHVAGLVPPAGYQIHDKCQRCGSYDAKPLDYDPGDLPGHDLLRLGCQDCGHEWII